MQSTHPKCQQMLDYIAAYIVEHQYPPSVRDITADLDISSTSVADYRMRALVDDGLIERDSRSRSIQLTARGAARVSPGIPVPSAVRVTLTRPDAAFRPRLEQQITRCIAAAKDTTAVACHRQNSQAEVDRASYHYRLERTKLDYLLTRIFTGDYDAHDPENPAWRPERDTARVAVG